MSQTPRIGRRRVLLRLAGAGGALAWIGCGERKPAPASVPANPTPPSAEPPPVAATPSVAPAPAPAVHTGRAKPTIRRGTVLAPEKLAGSDGSVRHLLSRIDLDAATLRADPFPIPFYGHGLAIDPRDPGRALVFEKKGPGCCLVDLRAGRMIREIPAQPGRQFYGHGVFNKDGAYIFCTETFTEDGTMRGVIAVRDSNTLRWKGDLPSFGHAPHDVVLSPDLRHLVVTNGGGTRESGHVPNLAWIDLRTHKVHQRLAFDRDDINAGHVAVAEDGAVAVVSAPRDGLDAKAVGVRGAFSFWRAGVRPEALRSARGPVAEAMRDETLSVAIDDRRGRIVATNPKGNQLSWWRLADGTNLGSTTRYVEPRGVAYSLDGSALLVSCGEGSELRLLSPETFEELPDGVLAESFTSGAHLRVIALDRA